ncbi:class I SAM-dependent methyltransferase [Aurantiacibacter flavus]|uniref:Methyltransferase domain-containing protein n=1 Tax=Aurantiacibacter flavus TaxID=3145232 RepID=A0ABV0D337_9SPHN
MRNSLEPYLGHYNFAGKRVLDVGAASGILSFHIERQGADVVSFDLSEDYDWDIVPFDANDNASARKDRRGHLRRINNGYWLCHKAFGSQAKMVNGVVYNIPAQIGAVDVAVFGSILLHLRDPFLALENGARLAQKTMIVADVSPYGRLASRFLKRPRFMPRADRPEWVTDGWFRLPPLLVEEYLRILGFSNTRITWGDYRYKDRAVPIYTIVAEK